MQAPKTFAREGIIVCHEVVADDRIDTLRDIAHYDDTLEWFSNVMDDDAFECDRRQAYLDDDTAVEVIGRVNRFAKTFFPRSQVRDLRFVKTIAGCKLFPVRRDFESPPADGDLLDVCAIPGSLIIATENIFLYTFGWNRKVPLKSHRKLIELNKGDMALLRGDLVYKPIGAKHKTVCLQAFLDPPDYLRPFEHHPHVLKVVDDTLDNQDPFCFIWRCHFRGHDLNAVRKHINRFHHLRFRRNRRRRRA